MLSTHSWLFDSKKRRRVGVALFRITLPGAPLTARVILNLVKDAQRPHQVGPFKPASAGAVRGRVDGVSTTVAANSHHALPAHEVVLLLETDSHRGLTGAAARERLERFGPNTLPAACGSGLLLRILRQFHHPLIYVLLVAGAVTAGLREYVDSAVIFGVVLVNAIVGFIQESKAEVVDLVTRFQRGV